MVDCSTGVPTSEMRLIYIANLRMPSERAHALQIMQMCQAFAEVGVDVRLLYTRRAQTNPALAGRDPFEFFGLETHFGLESARYLDFVPWKRFLGERAYRLAYLLSGLLWARTAARATRRLGVDVCLTREHLVAHALSRRGIPTILEVHQLGGAVARELIPRLARRSALRVFIAISEGLKEQLEEIGVPGSKIKVLHDAMRPDALRGMPRPLAREHLGLPASAPLAVYTGSLFESKGVYTLAEAAPHVKGEVVIVGGTAEASDRLRRYADARGARNVQVVQQVSPREAMLFQQAADVLVHPQIGGDAQSPLKLFEYMAARRPIVGTDVPALREVLTNNRNALLVPPKNAVALAGAVNRLLKDDVLSNRLADTASKDVSEQTWKRRAERMLESL